MGGRWLGLALVVGLFGIVVGGGAAAAAESDTVGSFGRGLWWSVSLVMTEGFIGQPPQTGLGQVISVVLMVTGFAMLSIVSASLASIFVRSDEAPRDTRDQASEVEVRELLERVLTRLDRLEARLDADPDPRTAARPVVPD